MTGIGLSHSQKDFNLKEKIMLNQTQSNIANLPNHEIKGVSVTKDEFNGSCKVTKDNLEKALEEMVKNVPPEVWNPYVYNQDFLFAYNFAFAVTLAQITAGAIFPSNSTTTNKGEEDSKQATPLLFGHDAASIQGRALGVTPSQNMPEKKQIVSTVKTFNEFLEEFKDWIISEILRNLSTSLKETNIVGLKQKRFQPPKEILAGLQISPTCIDAIIQDGTFGITPSQNMLIVITEGELTKFVREYKEYITRQVLGNLNILEEINVVEFIKNFVSPAEKIALFQTPSLLPSSTREIIHRGQLSSLSSMSHVQVNNTPDAAPFGTNPIALSNSPGGSSSSSSKMFKGLSSNQQTNARDKLPVGLSTPPTSLSQYQAPSTPGEDHDSKKRRSQNNGDQLRKKCRLDPKNNEKKKDGKQDRGSEFVALNKEHGLEYNAAATLMMLSGANVDTLTKVKNAEHESKTIVSSSINNRSSNNNDNDDEVRISLSTINNRSNSSSSSSTRQACGNYLDSNSNNSNSYSSGCYGGIFIRNQGPVPNIGQLSSSKFSAFQAPKTGLK